MPPINRRTFLTASVATVTVTSGCIDRYVEGHENPVDLVESDDISIAVEVPEYLVSSGYHSSREFLESVYIQETDTHIEGILEDAKEEKEQIEIPAERLDEGALRRLEEMSFVRTDTEIYEVEFDAGSGEDDVYFLELTEIDVEEEHRVNLRELDELSSEVRDIAEEAAGDVTTGYRADSLTQSFEDEIGEDDAFYIDGRPYFFEVHEFDLDDYPIDFGLDLVDGEVEREVEESEWTQGLEGFEGFDRDRYLENGSREEFDPSNYWDAYRPSGDPAEFSLSIRNTSSNRIEIGGGTPHPFDVLTVTENDAERDDEPIVLWSDSYEESGSVTLGPYGLQSTSELLFRQLKPDESMSESYQVDYPSGSYVVEDSIRVDEGGGEVRVPFGLKIEIT